MASSNKLEVFRGLFKDAAPKLADVIPATMRSIISAERITRIMLSAMGRSSKLMECSTSSILQVCLDGAALGLEVCGPLGHVYAVPFKGEAKTIIGYRGLLELARRSGKIGAVEAHVVHKNDLFELEYGRDPKLRHVPHLTNPGEVVAAYVVADISGVRQVDVMTKAEIDAVRKRSRASTEGPWVTDYEEMAKKTVLRRAWKYWPMSTEMSDAMAVDSDSPVFDAVEPLEEGTSSFREKKEEEPPHDPVTGEVAEKGLFGMAKSEPASDSGGL